MKSYSIKSGLVGIEIHEQINEISLNDIRKSKKDNRNPLGPRDLIGTRSQILCLISSFEKGSSRYVRSVALPQKSVSKFT